ncbi:calcium:proton antiporter [Leucobacter insecticola]|uniref:Calcium:proton antiporter n=1 Tax=Leucobacter insecticola TaxID=2714934 RepID=A0A6G8FGX4_9MICO|nr:calcium:proton antiporter [Leucobacter insecticola]QIM15282.1 calcium:proton antiporter [Leucobacter insecticola]
MIAPESPTPPRSHTPLRAILTPGAILRLLLGWGAFGTLLVLQNTPPSALPGAALAGLLTAIVGVILVCAFGVVIEAEHLAHRLGDPYGTLVLTLSIVSIEVILISAVMLSPGEHPTIARDSVMAVSMIILNLVIGVALIVGGLRRARDQGDGKRGLRHNRRGTLIYLAILLGLTALAFALPGLIGADGAYTPAQAIPIAALTVACYAFFLVRQMGAQKADFQEVSAGSDAPAGSGSGTSVLAMLGMHRNELIARTLLLIATVIPIVLLSHDMAELLDTGLDRLGAPIALSGLLIAMIVFLPETITTIRAAAAGEAQRVNNLCHGALVSTVGLTIPAVLTIGILTGQTVTLAESPSNLVLLGATLLLSIVTFARKRTTALHGAAHLAIFVLYTLTLFGV